MADEVRLISVTGVAQKSFVPDMVRLNLNLWGKGESAKKAQLNAQTYYEILKKSVETLKIKKEDIQTTSYDLNPDVIYNPKTGKNTTIGYVVNQGITLTLKKIENAGLFIDSLSTSSKPLTGGASVQSSGYDISNRAEEEKNLLEKAVEEAEAKAKVLASAAKVKLKGVFRLSPKGDSLPVFTRYSEIQADAVMAKSAPRTVMMSGEVKVSAEVQAQYIIE